MNSVGRALTVAALAAAGLAHAAALQTGLEFARMPLSVRAQSAGTYGAYDVLAVPENPALLASQPRTWAVGLSNQLAFGGDENLWGAAAGWAGAGPLGFAVLASGLGAGTVEERDILGHPTGASVSSAGLRYGAAAAYQWPSVQAGLAVGRAAETLTGISGPAVAAPATILLDAGLAGITGRVRGGAAYHQRGGGAASSVSLGVAVALESPFRGSLGGEFVQPLGGVAGVGTAGVTWAAHRILDLRVGALVPAGGGRAGRLGFALHAGSLVVDYAFSLPLGPGPGAAHLVALGYAFGAERQVGPQAAAVFAVSMAERTMAVATFDPQGVSATDAAVVADLLRSSLVQTAAFNIVEKANMDKVLQEQAFQQTGCTTQECAVKLGKVLNVKYLVVGTFAKTLDQYLLAARVVDVQTAKIVYADEAQGSSLAELRAAIKVLGDRMAGAVSRAK